jgi:hypothetical protein
MSKGGFRSRIDKIVIPPKQIEKIKLMYCTVQIKES